MWASTPPRDRVVLERSSSEAEDKVFSLSPQSALFGELSYVLAIKFAF